MRVVPVDNRTADWPRVVAGAVNALIRAFNAGTTTYKPMNEPSDPAEGLTYMDSTTHKLRTYDGTAWQDHW